MRKPKPKAIRRIDNPDKTEQLQVQLAGCTTAALGGTKKPAKRGDWGWSPAYQDVLILRRKYDRARKLLEEVKHDYGRRVNGVDTSISAELFHIRIIEALKK